MMAHKLFAFFKRDLLAESSYKFYFLSSMIGIIVSSATFFFISRLISQGTHSSLAPYGGDYFSFVIIGIAFSGILEIFHEGLPEVIRDAQITGTLESLLVTQTSLLTILSGSSLFSFSMSLIRTIAHLLLAIFVFGMKLGHIN
ncbi:MAG: ABC transporter permease, partial [Candidatus Aminicenantes bacterium]|nr:ABC transporter permease [Candidatus Aminicenantes bacterium]